MVKVESQDTLWLLTVRFMKINRRRNQIAILAIMLTTVLFTSLFTGAVSMTLSKLEADKKTYHSWSHVILQDITETQAQSVSEVLQKSSFVERFGVNTFVGTLKDKRILFQTEVRSADANTAEAFCNTEIQGRLPENKNEIALSSLVLDALSISYQTNKAIADQKISLTILLDNANAEEICITQDFYICGWWEGDVLDYSQYVWVSDAFAKEVVPEISCVDLENGAMSGAVSFSIWYKNLWNLREKTNNLGKHCGFLQTGIRGKGFQINPAYESLIDRGGLSGIFALIFLIMLAGYLIIYNVFSISVKTDLRAYALLKSVGTTGKQLAQIVRMQAFCLCFAGLPVGLLVGFFCGVGLSPALTADIGSIGHLTEIRISASPLIFVVAAVFVLATVYLSCIEACRIVSQVSPIEALHIAEGGSLDKKAKKRSKSVSASWWGMALGNFRCSYKRGMIVMLSIALSLVTVNGIFMMIQGYRLDAYQRVFMVSDFALDKLPDYAPYAVINGVTANVQAQLDACPYAECVGFVRYSEEYHKMEPHLYQVWDKIAQERLSGEWKKIWEQMKADNQMKITLMGIDQAAFDKLEWYGTACSWEAFSRGNAVLVDYPLLAGQGVHNYQAGDEFIMTYQSGIERAYQVLGEARLPYSLDYPYANLVTVTVLIPEEEFIACTGSDAAMRAFLDAASGAEEALQQYLDEIVLAEDSALLLRSVLDLKASFVHFLNKYYFVGGALAIVLALIGIMNFYNMTAASVLSRKRELALLETVGMTKKQLRRMLVTEGCLYLSGAFVIALGTTVLFGGRMLTAALGHAFFFEIKVTVLPTIVLLPVFFMIACLVPTYQFRKMGKESDRDKL